ncbi:MAG: hypothetical protein ACXVNN_00405 [Bacteroidia bacterium]
MKKFLIIASAVLFLSLTFSSCHTHHACAGVTTSIQKAKGNNSQHPL